MSADSNNTFGCFANERIELIMYTYRYLKKNGKWKTSRIRYPELLFSVCSWKQTCLLEDTLVQNITRNTKNGFLDIEYSCIGSVFITCFRSCVFLMIMGIHVAVTPVHVIAQYFAANSQYLLPLFLLQIAWKLPLFRCLWPWAGSRAFE